MSLTVQSEILGIALSAEQLESLSYKVPNSPSILIRVTTGKSLVCRVEEGEQVLSLYNLSDLLPLLLSGVTEENNNDIFE